MSEQKADKDQADKTEQPRDPQGRFGTKTKTDLTVKTQPTTSDYTKMNSYLAKQLGIEAKLADFQTKYEPEALFKQLSFMADNTELKVGNKPNALPENQPIAPISPQPNKHELPGVQLSTPNLTQEHFSVHYKIDPRDLFQPKKDKK